MLSVGVYNIYIYIYIYVYIYIYILAISLYIYIYKGCCRQLISVYLSVTCFCCGYLATGRQQGTFSEHSYGKSMNILHINLDLKRGGTGDREGGAPHVPPALRSRFLYRMFDFTEQVPDCLPVASYVCFLDIYRIPSMFPVAFQWRGRALMTWSTSSKIRPG